MGCRVFVCMLVLWVMALAGQAIAELNSGVAVAWAQPVLSGTVDGLPARVQGEQLTLMRQKLYDNYSKLNQTFWHHGVLAVTLEPQSTRIAFDDPRRTVEVLDVNPTPVKAVLSTGIPAIDQSPGLLFSGRETIRLVMDTLTCMTGLQAHNTYTLCPSSVSTQALTVLSSSDAESTIMRHNPEKTPVPSLDAFDGLAVESTLAEEESDCHRPSLALRLTDGSRVQFEIEPTEASGQQVSFSVETVGASNGVGKSSTHAEPSSKSDNNNGDGKNHIPQSGTPSYPSETKSLGDRSAIQTNKITSLKLRELISENKFSNDVRYQVEGYLYLNDCTGLTALPENLSVGGDLYLDGCTGLTALPENLSVVGYLSLDGCTGLTALPENLSVVGRLSLRGCTGLTALPENLSVGRDLSLDGCTGLTALPENLSVEGYLSLDGCTGLTALPENLSVGGNLSLSGCTGLTALPENLSVGGNLFLSGCTGLTALPENLSVKGYLSLDGCTGLTALPENLSVGGNLYLRHCTSLTALPENLSVEGYLSLKGCTGLSALPENLSVGDDLYLGGCTGLTALPESLSVGGSLSLRGCTGLMALPENLSVGGSLSLRGCTGLTALPNWITTMGLTSRGFIRHVDLENTGLSDALIDRMCTIRTPNMQFHFSESAGQPEQQFSDLEQGFAFWRRLASSNSEIPELDLRHDQADDLVCYLGRLTGTADYQNQTSRPVLAQRVMAVMLLLAGNDRVRETALRHIHDALSSCDDRIILALDDLETLQLLTSAETLAFENRDPRELKALGLQMMRLDAVKQFARDHMKTLSWVDAIEVELAFQIGVRQQLDLPGSTQHMIFRRCANVSDQDIANAVQHVNTYCSETQLEVYLAQWAPWQKFQRLLAAPSFDQLASTTVASIDDCFFCRKKTNKMVMLSDIHLDYDALVKAYLENGKNPFTNTPMDWSSVVRLIEEAPPLFKKRRLNDA